MHIVVVALSFHVKHDFLHTCLVNGTVNLFMLGIMDSLVLLFVHAYMIFQGLALVGGGMGLIAS